MKQYKLLLTGVFIFLLTGCLLFAEEQTFGPFTIENNNCITNIHLKNKDIPVHLEFHKKIKINSYGELQKVHKENINKSTIKLNLYKGVDLIILNYTLSNSGLTINADVLIPAFFGKYRMFTILTIDKKGNWKSQAVKHMAWQSKNIPNMEVSYMYFKPNYIDIAYVSVEFNRFPPLGLEDIRLLSDGTITIQNVDYRNKPVYKGLEFFLTKGEITASHALIFHGSEVRLPKSFPGDLSGYPLTLDNLTFSITDKLHISFTAHTDDNLTIYDEYGDRIKVKNITMQWDDSKPLVLKIPAETMEAGNWNSISPVEDFYLNTETGEWITK